MPKDIRDLLKTDCRTCVRTVFEKELYHLLSMKGIPVFQEIKTQCVLVPEDAVAFKWAFDKTVSEYYNNRFRDLETALADSYLPVLTLKERGCEWERIRSRIMRRTRKFLPEAAKFFESRYARREYYGYD